MVKTSDSITQQGEMIETTGDKFHVINANIVNLIDSINPYQKAYEVVSKNVDAETLKIIQDTIAEQKFDMTIHRSFSTPVPYKEGHECRILYHKGLFGIYVIDGIE